MLYKRQPGKVFADSYTSNCQKILVACILTLPLWLMPLWWFEGIRTVAASLALMSGTTVPSTAAIARTNGLRVAAIAPFMQVVASSALAIGLGVGAIHHAVPGRQNRGERT